MQQGIININLETAIKNMLSPIGNLRVQLMSSMYGRSRIKKRPAWSFDDAYKKAITEENKENERTYNNLIKRS